MMIIEQITIPFKISHVDIYVMFTKSSPFRFPLAMRERFFATINDFLIKLPHKFEQYMCMHSAIGWVSKCTILARISHYVENELRPIYGISWHR